jgi:hypothetical protein
LYEFGSLVVCQVGFFVSFFLALVVLLIQQRHNTIFYKDTSYNTSGTFIKAKNTRDKDRVIYSTGSAIISTWSCSNRYGMICGFYKEK